MKATIVYYTNCLAPKRLILRTLRDAMAVAEKNDWNMVVSSHFPLFEDFIDSRIDFHHLARTTGDEKADTYLKKFSRPALPPHECVTNYVTGVLSYSPETILTQIVHAIDHAGETDAVLLWEHDVLYPEGYAEKMVKAIRGGKDFAVYRDNVFMDHDGFFSTAVCFWHLSRYGGSHKALRSHFDFKIALGNYALLEPVPRGQETGEETEMDIVDSFEIIEGPPVVDIKHGANASGQILVDNHENKHPHWGKFSSLKKLIDDKAYLNFINSKPEVGYGLFTVNGFFFR